MSYWLSIFSSNNDRITGLNYVPYLLRMLSSAYSSTLGSDHLIFMGEGRKDLLKKNPGPSFARKTNSHDQGKYNYTFCKNVDKSIFHPLN